MKWVIVTNDDEGCMQYLGQLMVWPGRTTDCFFKFYTLMFAHGFPTRKAAIEIATEKIKDKLIDNYHIHAVGPNNCLMSLDEEREAIALESHGELLGENRIWS